MYAVGLNLIQLSAIGLLYLELPVSIRVPGVNDPLLTSNGSVTGQTTLTTHPLGPARYFTVSSKDDDTCHLSCTNRNAGAEGHIKGSWCPTPGRSIEALLPAR